MGAEPNDAAADSLRRRHDEILGRLARLDATIVPGVVRDRFAAELRAEPAEAERLIAAA